MYQVYLIIFPMERGTKLIRELLFLHYGDVGAAHILLLLVWFSDCPQKKNGKLSWVSKDVLQLSKSSPDDLPLLKIEH